MKIFIALLLCMSMFGCATPAKRRQLEAEIEELKKTLIEKDAVIAKYNITLKRLQESLVEKELQLKQKDAKIEELSSKLKVFGVFQQ